MTEDFWIKILSTVLASLILSIIYGSYKLVQKVNALDASWTGEWNKLTNANTEYKNTVNNKLDHLFVISDAQLETLSAIMLYIQHGIKNGELDEAAKKLKNITYTNKKG